LTAMTGRFGDQTSLDSYLTTLDNFSGEDEDGELEVDAEGDEAEAGRCGVCGEGSRFERLRLHAGALCLYFKDGRWLARADIDHVYHKCRKGLIDNLRLLRLMGRGWERAGDDRV